MALYSTSVEYGLHCLLPLCAPEIHASSQDLAEFQGISPAYLAKLFATLKRAGLVIALEGAGGGYQLARPATEITVLDVVIALEGDKPLFQCNEIRGNCAVFGGQPPAWASKGLCSIHAVMLEAEQQMRKVLASHTLADLAARLENKAPKTFPAEVTAWFGARRTTRARGATRAPFNRGEN
jgi:Rrf2 family protein